jgi:hypothetical protein
MNALPTQFAEAAYHLFLIGAEKALDRRLAVRRGLAVGCARRRDGLLGLAATA